MRELLKQIQSLLGLKLTSWQAKAIEIYEQELLAWNERTNLTAIREVEQIRIKHFLDSLTCTLAFQENIPTRLIDIGSGAGFPGIPLKIIYPNTQLTLVESIGKKTNFCRHITQILGLEGVQILQERAEAVGRMPEHREHYDFAVARAVAVMPILSEYLLPLVKIGGRAIAMKGENAPAEAQSADFAVRLLGGHFKKLIPITLPTVVEQRYLVVLDKVSATPAPFPRRTGIPAKHPLTAGQKPVLN